MFEKSSFFSSEPSYDYELLEDDDEDTSIATTTTRESRGEKVTEPQIYYAALYLDGTLLIGEGKTASYVVGHKALVAVKTDTLNVSQLSDGRIMSDTELSSAVDLFVFKSQNIVYIACSDKGFPKRITDKFLRDTAAGVEALGGSVANQALVNVVKAQLSRHNNRHNDPLCQSQAKVDDAAREAYRTLDKILNKGRKMDDLMHESKMLVQDSYQGKRRSRTLARHTGCVTTTMITVSFCIVILFIVGTILLLLFRIGVWGDPRDYFGIEHDPNEATTLQHWKDSVNSWWKEVQEVPSPPSVQSV